MMLSNFHQTQSVTIYPTPNFKTLKRDAAFQILTSKFSKKYSDALYLEGAEDRTVKSNRKIAKGELIFSIPSKFFLSQKLIDWTPLYHYINFIYSIKHRMEMHGDFRCTPEDAAKIDKIESQSLISCMNGLIYYFIERRFMPNASEDHQSQAEVKRIQLSYIESLPSSYSFHPQNFMEDIRKFHPYMHQAETEFALQFEAAALTIRRLIRNEYRLSCSFRSFLEAKGKGQLFCSYECEYTRERIFWALFAFRTRNYKGHGMVPLLDMLNHSPAAATRTNCEYLFDPHTMAMNTIATRDIHRGEEILLSYCDSSLQAIYFTYGFISPQEYCEVIVQFEYNHRQFEICLKAAHKDEEEASLKDVKRVFREWIEERKAEHGNLIEHWNIAIIIFMAECGKLRLDKQQKVGQLDEEIEMMGGKGHRCSVLKALRMINLREEQILQRIGAKATEITNYFVSK